jgi:sulfotransferase family protein
MDCDMVKRVFDRTSGNSNTEQSYGAKLRRELEDDYRVFYVTAWGYAADHYFGWLPKALNIHPEIFALLAHEGSRPKYMRERTRAERPALIPFTEFLNDMGMTYEAIGDCYSYRAGQMPELLGNPRYANIPAANLVRHPIIWLEFYVRWRASNMRMRAGATDPLAWEWKVAHHGTFRSLGLRLYEKDEVNVWAAFQGMNQLNNIVGDVSSVTTHIPIESVASQPETFNALVHYLTKGKCIYEQSDLDRLFAMTKTLFRGEEPVETDPKTLMESWPGWKIDGFRALLTPTALDVYKSFGYDLFGLDRPAPVPVRLPNEPSRPIFVSSVMKSGTWLLRAILEDMTGLKGHEPEIGEGTPAYDDEMLIDIPPGHFFIWHSVLVDRSTALLRGAGTKNIFLVRNVFDLIVSMYNHLRRDADASIGRSVKGAGYLAQLPPDAAMSMMISGFTSPELTWDGIGPHIRQIASFFRFREDGGDALILSYEELTRDKAATVRKIAQYLENPIDDQRVANIVLATDFDTMKKKASKLGADGHFTDHNDRAVKRAIQPYHVAMVSRIAMTEMPNPSEQTAKAGMPWLFDYREN